MIIKKDLQIAIDGPVSSGTSTLSLALARKLNFLFIYTGAMYRAAAYLYITAKNKGSILSEPELVQLVKSRKITLKKPSKPVIRTFLFFQYLFIISRSSMWLYWYPTYYLISRIPLAYQCIARNHRVYTRLIFYLLPFCTILRFPI